MPPRAAAATTSASASYSDDEDFIVGDDDVDSGDDFMDGDDDQRHFQRKRGVRPAAANANNKQSASNKRKKGPLGGIDASKSYAWESSFQRSWDVVNEDETGSLEASVKHLLAAGKRKRAAREERRVRRGIIRHLVLVIDDSENMNEKDGGRGRR